MLRSDHSTDRHGRLLRVLSAELRLPPEQITKTAAWHAHSESSYSLDPVELVMLVHEELECRQFDESSSIDFTPDS